MSSVLLSLWEEVTSNSSGNLAHTCTHKENGEADTQMLFHFITPHHKLLMATHLILANLLQTDSITATTSLLPPHLSCISCAISLFSMCGMWAGTLREACPYTALNRLLVCLRESAKVSRRCLLALRGRSSDAASSSCFLCSFNICKTPQSNTARQIVRHCARQLL